MALTRIGAASGALAALAVSAAPSMLQLQTDGLSQQVAQQANMVQTFVTKFLKEKAPVTQVEKDMLDLVEKTFQETTLPNIQAGHEQDLQVLDNHVVAIQNCQVGGNSVQDALTKVTNDIDACYSEEERKLGLRKAALATLNGFRASVSAAGEVSLALLQTGSSSSAHSIAPGCSGPDTSEWGQWGTFLSRTGKWYADNAAQLHTHADAWRAAVDAHEKQKALCEKKQIDFEHKYCMWHSAINKTKDDYTECRDNAIKALDDTWPIVVENMRHRKADYTAVKHVQCLLEVILGSDDDKADGLRACMKTVIDTAQLTINKPPPPETFEDDLDTMLSDIATRHRGVTGSERETIQKTKEMCEKDSIEVIEKKHDDDQVLINGLLDDVKQCETVREQMTADVTKRNEVLAAARSDYKACRAEEDRLKGLMDAASASLEGFITDSRTTGPDCNMPKNEDKTGLQDYFATRKQWYADSDERYNNLWEAYKGAKATYDAQVAVCDGKQVVYETRYCEWSDAVSNTRAVYKECRDTTVPKLDNTYSDVLVLEKERRDDYQSIRQEECFLDTILADDTTNEALHACSVKEIDTTHLIVDPPVKPDYATQALADLGDLAAEGVSCAAASLAQESSSESSSKHRRRRGKQGGKGGAPWR